MPPLLLPGLRNTNPDPETLIETMRTLVVAGQYDPMQSVGMYGLQMELLRRYLGPIDGYALLLNQEEFFIDPDLVKDSSPWTGENIFQMHEGAPTRLLFEFSQLRGPRLLYRYTSESSQLFFYSHYPIWFRTLLAAEADFYTETWFPKSLLDHLLWRAFDFVANDESLRRFFNVRL